jgi:hypothetical protein
VQRWRCRAAAGPPPKAVDLKWVQEVFDEALAWDLHRDSPLPSPTLPAVKTPHSTADLASERGVNLPRSCPGTLSRVLRSFRVLPPCQALP